MRDTLALTSPPPLQKQKRKKKAPGVALGDLSALGLTLGEIQRNLPAARAPKKPRGPRKGLGTGGLRARERLNDSESQRLAAVVAHPTFQADPLAAIASHLGSTLPPPPPPGRVKKVPGPKLSGSQKRKLKRMKALAAADGEGDGYMADVSE